MYMKLGEHIENIILYAVMCLLKAQYDQSFEILNSTNIIRTELG